ncbi:uncharacterized protein LOC117340619 [Pecten maximus]|uniref:uncharacterized protein LOC117340619 n=1 Tax=Pecten maximus TaxID=6579 RepID=UPI00145808C9|nr:uncharacterized protein LOC117340619 [Pecten maximus]
MSGTQSSPVLVPVPLLKKRHHPRRRILDTEAAKTLRKKLFIDENARESFDADAEVLFIAESPVKKVQIDKESPRMVDKTHHNNDLSVKQTESSGRVSGKDICQLDIGNSHYVVANHFQGRHWVHIRVYEKGQNNSTYPTKKGIALDLEKWMKLITWYADAVDDAIKGYDDNRDTDLHLHLGANYFVSVKQGYPVVNIRRWFLPENEESIKPTRKGITLTFRQWEKVKDSMLVLKDLIGAELDNVRFCELADDHQNQMGMLQCSNCNPNGTMF